jgi:hypothetical protein
LNHNKEGYGNPISENRQSNINSNNIYLVNKDKTEKQEKEKDSFFRDHGALLKKKDLNVYLYDKQKFRNNSKKPFK